MARPPRYPSPATELQAGRIFHVTNRGVDRCALFHSDFDRVVFLSLVADACARTGAVCHAFCLMTNHFHLVVEDVRGLLSQFMHGIAGPYASYFNATRGRVGPLFQGRFRSDEIDTRAYFDDACAYVVNNPLRTAVPLVEYPDEFRWSSAPFVLGEEGETAAAHFAELLAPFGGVDGVLEGFEPAARLESEALRRRRVEALASGAWLERDHVLGGRTPAAYRAHLAARLAASSPFARGSRQELGGNEAIEPSARRQRRLPSRPSAFAGLTLGVARDQIEAACARLVPAMPEQALAYLLVRFCSASVAEIARALKKAPAAVAEAVEQVRAARLGHAGWSAALWRVEWSLHWRMLAGPIRS